MEILNNRELAIFFWLVFISIYIFSAKKMIEARKALKNLISAFFVRLIISVSILMIIYMGAIVYTLSKFDLWNVDQTKNTVFWCGSVGFISLFRLESLKKDKNFFKHSVISNLKLLAVIQFVVGVYTFPLLVEIMLVPVLAVIGAMTVAANSDIKYAQVKKLLEYLLSAFGLIVIAYTLYMLTTNFGALAKEKTLYDFMVPPLLTLFYLPFIFIMMVYSTYEQVFLRLRYAIKGKKLRFIAKLYAVVAFNIQIGLIERWSIHIARENVASYRDLIGTFKHLFKVRKAEHKPLEVPLEEGWSPYKAKDFLSKEGVKTGCYNKIFNEWCASSHMVEFGEGLIRDNVAYYVEGTEKVANTLKIILNINDSSRSSFAQKKLLDLSSALSQASLSRGLSDSVRNAILNGDEYSELHGNKKVSVTKATWPMHRFGGNDVKFIVSSI